MSRWVVTRTIAAPVALVFSTVADITQFSLVSRLMTRLIHRMVQKALERDMDSVKAFCERGEATPSTSHG